MESPCALKEAVLVMCRLEIIFAQPTSLQYLSGIIPSFRFVVSLFDCESCRLASGWNANPSTTKSRPHIGLASRLRWTTVMIWESLCNGDENMRVDTTCNRIVCVCVMNDPCVGCKDWQPIVINVQLKVCEVVLMLAMTIIAR